LGGQRDDPRQAHMKNASLTINLGGSEPSSPADIFWQGQGFFLAGSRCLLDIEVGPGITQCLVSPGVVNLCLAIELFLKSLLALHNQTIPKSHKLVELFASVPEMDQQKIKDEYGKSISVPSFEELLTQIEDYFVKVRYGYEFDVFNYQETPVFVFAKELYKYCASAHGVKVGVERFRL
jgi:HEPN domain-containing protein